MLSCKPTISKFTIQTDSMRTNLAFATTSRGYPLKTRKFCIAECGTEKNLVMKFWKRLCLNFFSPGEWKGLADPDSVMMYCKLGNDIFSTSELLHPNKMFRLRLIRVRPNYYMITTTSTLVFEMLIAHSTPAVLLSKKIITKTNGHACLYSYGIPNFWGSSKGFYHFH